MTATANKHFSTLQLAYIALCTALIAICSYISIPTAIPFTLQTLAVFLILQLVGGRSGFFAVLTYLLLGAVGVPVFAQFTGGPGVLFGTTGGYLIGFLLMAALYWTATALLGDKPAVRIVSLILGLFICYAFGTAWFLFLYNRSNDPVGVGTALGWCVLPFLLPDAVKFGVATGLAAVLRPHIKQA